MVGVAFPLRGGASLPVGANLMRINVATKTWAACVTIVALGSGAVAVAYHGLGDVQQALRRLAEVHEPAKSATHEMEINVKELAVWTLGYVNTLDPMYQRFTEDDAADFAMYFSEYRRLASTDEERRNVDELGALFEEFHALGRELIELREQQAGAFQDVLTRLEEMDEVLDTQLQATRDPKREDHLRELQVLHEIEADLAEMGMSVAAYGWFRRQEDAERIQGNAEEAAAALAKLTSPKSQQWTFRMDECRATLKRLRNVTWTEPKQRDAVRFIEEDFDVAMANIADVFKLEDHVRSTTQAFLELRGQIDDLLDERIQPLAVEQVRRPRQEADAAATEVAERVRWIMPAFVLAAMLATLSLTRTVTRPLKLLTRGTETVSRGDLTQRLTPVSNDEFADLTQAFNAMIGRLGETLVSKERLEQSEARLSRTVSALREEIAERERAEQERTRLEAALRRSETLSAMGVLVAGVAHQVRNPLFAMSSALDAMEARIGTRDASEPYVRVLREQNRRVALLMDELMEYGRPADHAEQVDLREAVEEAVRACQARADAAGVRLVVEGAESSARVSGDRRRLARAVENLLENAIQHAPRDSTVRVSCARTLKGARTWTEIRVEDCGSGFKAEDIGRVFDPFFSRRPGGTGLGLALVERIVTACGGAVFAENRAEGGARLTARFPAEG
ncbi:MAG: sensor histidine kinase [Planctomycetota bacterium]|nr:MAG: sensor histidine kinase [Planctomycetota bacterium]MCQ3921183.1 hypothetical protein [Planctomycetota bacterium]